jgi:hypothetical protein
VVLAGCEAVEVVEVGWARVCATMDAIRTRKRDEIHAEDAII